MQREGIRTARIILMHPVGLFAVNDIHHTSDTCFGKRIQTTLSADYHTSTTNLNEDDGFRAFQVKAEIFLTNSGEILLNS